MDELGITKYEKPEEIKLSKFEEFIQTIKTGFKKDEAASYPVRFYKMKWEIVEHDKAQLNLNLKALTGKTKGALAIVNEMTNDELEAKLIELKDKVKKEKELEAKNEKELSNKK